MDESAAVLAACARAVRTNTACVVASSDGPWLVVIPDVLLLEAVANGTELDAGQVLVSRCGRSVRVLDCAQVTSDVWSPYRAVSPDF